MKLSQYNYNFSADMLAKYPAENRDESRLMVLNRKTGKIEHRIFKDVIDYFKTGDIFIFNDTKVFPARLYGNKEKTGAEIEIFLLRELNRDLRLWDVLVDPARKIRIGNKLYFGDDDPNVFNEDMFNFRRITLAPILVLGGFVFEIYAIMKKPKKKREE